MSWEHLHAAFNYKGNVGETALHVLLRIAFEIRDNGYAFPGTQYLAEKIHVSRKTVQRAINELKEAGAIQVTSGRFAGHKNHYVLTIPDAPQGGTKTTSTLSTGVDNSFNNVGQKRPHENTQGRICPTPVGHSRQALGQTPLPTWDKDDLVRRNIEKENQETVRTIQPSRIVPPLDGTIHKLPPVGTVEFKAYAIHFAMSAGASLIEARRFYEHNEAETWRILDQMPLEVAAAEHVKAWKERDPRAFLTEQFSRMKEAGK